MSNTAIKTARVLELTPQLRWIEYFNGSKRLEQCWIDKSDGYTEWVEVPKFYFNNLPENISK